MRETIGRPGREIAGRYKLVRLVGRGGMGEIWSAEDARLNNRLVAIKLLCAEEGDNEEARARFIAEAHAAAAIRSPHVVQIYDYGVEQDGTPYIAMELLEGESLADRLERVHTLSPPETARIIVEVCRGLSRAHEANIVHRDLKPDNIFIVSNGDTEVAKLLDFGIAKTLGGESKTRAGVLVGTPYYCSYEQACGKPVDHRTDVWAIAVIAFECLTGQRPFVGKDLSELVMRICAPAVPVPAPDRVPAGFGAWFARGVDRDMERRFQSVQETAEQLRLLCEANTARTVRAPAPGSLDMPIWAFTEVNPVLPSPPVPAPNESSSERKEPASVVHLPRRFGLWAIMLFGALFVVALAAATGAVLLFSKLNARAEPTTTDGVRDKVHVLPSPPIPAPSPTTEQEAATTASGAASAPEPKTVDPQRDASLPRVPPARPAQRPIYDPRRQW